MTHPIFTRVWWVAALIRAVRTVAQVAVSLIGVDMVGVLAVDWVGVLSVSAVAGLVSVLTSVAGLPEVEEPTTDA